jgi:hypothetical protein
VVVVTLPEMNLGPPRQADGAPAETDTPTDHSNVKSHFIKQYCNATLGRWSPLTWALRLACRLWNYQCPDGDLVTSIMHDIWQVTDQVADDQFPRAEVASCIRSAKRYVGPETEIPQQWIESLRRVL